MVLVPVQSQIYARQTKLGFYLQETNTMPTDSEEAIHV